MSSLIVLLLIFVASFPSAESMSFAPSRSGAVFSSLLLSAASSLPSAHSKKRTHYDVLDIPQDASLQDIKKAYRKLAVQHHPDRNIGKEEEATIRFREISEAYEILSDEKSRRQYDQLLKYGGEGSRSDGTKVNWSTGGGGHRRTTDFKYRDPFAQFNDVFRNDPFFADAFKSLDDLFDKHFSSFGSEAGKQNGDRGMGGGLWSSLKKFMPDFKVETRVSSGGGSASTRSYSSSRGRGRGGSSTYTSRSTRTTIENGQRVTIQSLEKDGNRIEEKYIGDKLIERKINGLKQDVGKITQGEF